MAKIWSSELGSKGILLAPVSALVGTTPAELVDAERVATGRKAQAPVNPAG
jgi:uncharacterized protein